MVNELGPGLESSPRARETAKRESTERRSDVGSLAKNKAAARWSFGAWAALLAVGGWIGLGQAQEPRRGRPADRGGAEAARPASGEEAEVTAAQVIAELNRRRRSRVSAAERARIDNLKTFEYSLEGTEEAQILQEAAVRALKNTAALLYFENYVLLGRDLLEPYLRVYGDRFVARRVIKERRILADGSRRLRVEVGVNVDRLYEDLAEKRFVAKPKVRPIVAVAIEETLDGAPIAQAQARRALERELRANELRVESERLEPIGLGLDLTANPQALRRFRDEAQRANVDVIITGRLRAQSQPDRVVLFDQFFFREGELHLSMIRVDTGEVMRETRRRATANGLDPAAALTALLEAVAQPAAAGLTEGFFTAWGRLMLEQSDFRLAVIGVDETRLASLTHWIRSASPQVEVFVKSFYGDVAVVNVVYPGADADRMIEVIRKSRVPQFRIVQTEEGRFELLAL